MSDYLQRKAPRRLEGPEMSAPTHTVRSVNMETWSDHDLQERSRRDQLGLNIGVPVVAALAIAVFFIFDNQLICWSLILVEVVVVIVLSRDLRRLDREQWRRVNSRFVDSP